MLCTAPGAVGGTGNDGLCRDMYRLVTGWAVGHCCRVLGYGYGYGSS